MLRLPSSLLPALLVIGSSALLAPPAALAEPGDVAAPCPPPCPPPAPPCDPCVVCSGAEAKKPPAKYENLRFREDWSPLLCTPMCDRCDLTDRWKAVPLFGDCAWMNFGGQVRFRFESFTGQNFGGIANADDSWLLSRVRLHADFHFGESVRAYVEGIYADQATREAGPRATDENHGDLLNAFVDVMGHPYCDTELGVRVGRYEMNYGKQRVIGAFDWANTRRSYEGFAAWWKTSGWKLDAFFNRPVPVAIDKFDERDEHAWFAGLEYSNTRCKDMPWEAYALFLHRDAAKWLGVTDKEDRATLGVLAGWAIPGTRLDWEAEAAYQFGDFGPQHISAGFVTAELGWKPCAPCWEPRIAVGVDYASGDSDGAGGDLGTYNQLFPTGHLWFGYADLIGRQNVVAARLTVTAKPSEKLTARADFHEFWRAVKEDGVYNAGGALLRAASASDELHVGAEADLTLKYAFDRHWDAEAGYAHVFAGQFLKATGAHDDVDFVWLGVTFTF